MSSATAKQDEKHLEEKQKTLVSCANVANVANVANALSGPAVVSSIIRAPKAPKAKCGPEKPTAWEFNWCMKKFRAFFEKKGLVESATQTTVDILSACEDTENLGKFLYVDNLYYPLKQTGQMVLEDELLRHPKAPGFFCQTTSYRFEKNPKPERHEFVFAMMEFEIPGSLEILIQFERELLEFFGFGKAASFPQADYLEICKQYGVEELTHEHELQLLHDYGPVFFLTNFPEHTSPFWNMKRFTIQTKDHDNKNSEILLSKKCDVILNGIETIGSAERSCDTKEMKESFYTIKDGKYSEALFDEFQKERVSNDFETFLQHNFFVRSGAGIGVSRMIRACKAAKLIPKCPY